MILDSLDYRSCYAEMPELKKILDAMADIHADSMPQTKMVIDGDKAFINPVTLTTKPFAETKFEAHQRYADVHCIIAGTEEIIVNDLSKVTEIELMILNIELKTQVVKKYYIKNLHLRENRIQVIQNI